MLNNKITGARVRKGIGKILGFGIPPRDAFNSDHYRQHNQRRLEHLASLELPLHGRSVLEVGAGIGDHTSFFIDRNCRVVSTEARAKNLKLLRFRYPDIEVRYLDLDEPDGFGGTFDIVYCYAVLNHLRDPVRALEFMSGCCRKIFLLEADVSPGRNEQLNVYKQNVNNPTQAISGIGCRPTRRWVYSRLKQHFEFVYLPITQPCHEEFPLDWSSPLDDRKFTRAVFIASREKLDNSILVEAIPMSQRRH